MNKILISLAAILMMVSCGEENLNLTINSPDNGAVYDRGEQIVISYTVTDDIDITTIAYYNNKLGTGSVAAAELLGDQLEYSGQFTFPADADPGEYDISVSATDEAINNVVEEIVRVVIR